MNDKPESANQSSAAGATDANVEQISAIVVDIAFHIHKDIGPGLLETVYRRAMNSSMNCPAI
jgi:hypothetical protein